MKTVLKHIVLAIYLLLTCLVSNGQLPIVYWDFPNNPDDNLADVYSPLNAGKLLTRYPAGTVNYVNAGNATNCASDTGWQAGSGFKYWLSDLTTTGYTNIFVSSVLRSSPDGPRDFQLQYKAGSSGVWTVVPGASAITVADDFTTGVVASVQLPSACDNKTLLKLRWIMTSNVSVSGGTVLSSGISYIDEVYIQTNYLGHFRSVQSGNWNQPGTWETSNDSINWTPSSFTPNNYSNSIVIQNGHAVIINSKVRADEIFVNLGATLSYLGDKLSIADGPACDLNVIGTLIDNTDTVCQFETGASWQLGANGTYIKSGAASAILWQTCYYNGIQNIPATAHWIVRKISVAINPPLSTSSGSPTGSYYPNLTIENNTMVKWDITSAPSSSFNGPTYYPVIKGNFDVGGNGLSQMIFYNQQWSAFPTRVLGDLIVRSGSSILNDGTGLEVQGNVNVAGLIYYTKGKFPRFNFSGGNVQSVTGPGSIGIYDMSLAKSSGNVTLNIPLTIDHNITFNGGKLNTDLNNILIVDTSASATILNQNSFVNGPVRKLGTSAFIYPIGKSRIQTLGLNTGGTYETFWYEDFGSACAAGCDANNFATSKGQWKVTDLATPGANANKFYISYSENGATSGMCSTPGTGNSTLHISKPISVGGDIGTAYYPGNSPSATSNKRAESPVINCTGKRGIQLTFDYFEGGSGVNDDAMLYYFDGSTWTMILNLAKTATTCGTVGYWTQQSLFLPPSSYNNPNVKVGFNWKNNNDGVGTSVSFAVDNIRLGEPMSITTEYFDADPKSSIGSTIENTMDDLTTCGYWNVKNDAGTTSKLVSLMYDNSSCYITLPSFMRVARFDTVAGANIWRDLGNGGINGVTSGMLTSANSVTDFGNFTIGYLINPLPVELINFEVKALSNTVKLNWQTASEPGLDYFMIEKSANLQTVFEFEQIKKQGTDNSGFYYDVVDRFPLNGVSYYRLKMVDVSGEFKYSNWISVIFKNEDIGLFCNFDFDSQSLIFSIPDLQNSPYTIQITDVAGRVIIAQNGVLNNFNRIGLQKVSAGVYKVALYAADRVFTSKFFVK